jgi:hypothetical protein
MVRARSAPGSRALSIKPKPLPATVPAPAHTGAVRIVARVVAHDTDYCGGVKLDLKADIETWIQEIIKPGAAPRQPELNDGPDTPQPVNQELYAEAPCCPALRTLLPAHAPGQRFPARAQVGSLRMLALALFYRAHAQVQASKHKKLPR